MCTSPSATSTSRAPSVDMKDWRVKFAAIRCCRSSIGWEFIGVLSLMPFTCALWFRAFQVAIASLVVHRAGQHGQPFLRD
ncbi:MAG: hypothetical protein AMXMBFR59_36360 [Rhodanobacteraceae bacterium]